MIALKKIYKYSQLVYIIIYLHFNDVMVWDNYDYPKKILQIYTIGVYIIIYLHFNGVMVWDNYDYPKKILHIYISGIYISIYTLMVWWCETIMITLKKEL